jgi:hypothetical protein
MPRVAQVRLIAGHCQQVGVRREADDPGWFSWIMRLCRQRGITQEGSGKLHLPAGGLHPPPERITTPAQPNPGARAVPGDELMLVAYLTHFYNFSGDESSLRRLYDQPTGDRAAYQLRLPGARGFHHVGMPCQRGVRARWSAPG